MIYEQHSCFVRLVDTPEAHVVSVYRHRPVLGLEHHALAIIRCEIIRYNLCGDYLGTSRLRSIRLASELILGEALTSFNLHKKDLLDMVCSICPKLSIMTAFGGDMLTKLGIYYSAHIVLSFEWSPADGWKAFKQIACDRINRLP